MVWAVTCCPGDGVGRSSQATRVSRSGRWAWWALVSVAGCLCAVWGRVFLAVGPGLGLMVAADRDLSPSLLAVELPWDQ